MALVFAATLFHSIPGTAAEQTTSAAQTNDVIAMIRDEGMNRSQIMETLRYLTEVIGPRLTASPAHKRANEWTRDRMASWGLTNAKLEAWGPFGRGWTLKRFSAQVIEPQAIPLAGCPAAWSPGLEKPIVGDVVDLDTRNTADQEKYKGQLKGAIVLVSPVREVRPRFEPLATRMNETNLLRLANAGEQRSSRPAFTRPPPPPPPERGTNAAVARNADADRGSLTSTNRAAAAPLFGGPGARGRSGPRYLPFLISEGAALVVNSSPMGDGGTFFVSSASIPLGDSGTNRFMGFASGPRAWSTNAPPTLPQITLATEDYNRLVRMIQSGEKLKMAVELEVKFQDEDLMAYNTVAEIPGTDLKDEVVMLGGHLDSWHAGTGATDDAIGVAVAMEAVRILQALKLQPRRTIRVGLWAGEEQGLLGSKAYVTEHFGYYTNQTETTVLRAPKDEEDDTPKKKSPSRSTPTRKLVKLRDYEKFSGYFNFDNGAGKSGIHLQGNDGVRSLFRRWLEPFGIWTRRR